MSRLALRQAETEEPALVRSERSSSGYWNVSFDRNCKTKAYKAEVVRDGRKVTLGRCATAEEAAMLIARTPEGQEAAAAPTAPPPTSAEEARRQALAEGLTLQKSERSNAGYRGVAFRSGRRMPYEAQVTRGGKDVFLGAFATAEEAALCYARSSEAQAAAAALLEPPRMTAEEALRQAEAEGLTLVRSQVNGTGYRNVISKSGSKHGSVRRPYEAQVKRGGQTVHLGYFATPEEAALCYARSPEAQALAAEPPPLTAEEALRQAEAEGLTLLRAESNQSGYKGVSINRNSTIRPYQPLVKRGGRLSYLGAFATVEEAALCYARTPEAQAAVAAGAAAAAPPALPPLTAEEAQAQAEAEGLTLLKSASSSTGFKGVALEIHHKTKPYRAEVRRGGERAFLCRCATAEEAALHVARSSAAHAAAPQPPATSSRKRKATTTEEQPPSTPVLTLECQFEGERRLSERFEELEECRERGILTEEEYAQKRAELMACF